MRTEISCDPRTDEVKCHTTRLYLGIKRSLNQKKKWKRCPIKTNPDLANMTQKTKYRAIQTQRKTVNFSALQSISSSCLTRSIYCFFNHDKQKSVDIMSENEIVLYNTHGHVW